MLIYHGVADTGFWYIGCGDVKHDNTCEGVPLTGLSGTVEPHAAPLLHMIIQEYLEI